MNCDLPEKGPPHPTHTPRNSVVMLHCAIPRLESNVEIATSTNSKCFTRSPLHQLNGAFDGAFERFGVDGHSLGAVRIEPIQIIHF